MSIGEISNKLKEQIWIKDEFTCQSCGRTINWEDLRICHIIPDYKGGRCEPSNLMAICRRCYRDSKSRPDRGEVERSLLSMIGELSELKEEVKEQKTEKRGLEEELNLLEGEFEKLMKEYNEQSERFEHQSSLTNAFMAKYERVMKDLENHKRRREHEVNLQVRNRSKPLIIGIIETLDNLERALMDMEDSGGGGKEESISRGLESMMKALLRTLDENDVKMIYPNGDLFDPRFHEAVDMVKDKSVPDNTVIGVENRGYSLHDQTIRPAKVIVARGGRKIIRQNREGPQQDEERVKRRKLTVVIEEEEDQDWEAPLEGDPNGFEVLEVDESTMET